jgi:hypothetical protein
MMATGADEALMAYRPQKPKISRGYSPEEKALIQDIRAVLLR